MKLKKLLLPLVLVGFALSGCAPIVGPSDTSNQVPDSSDSSTLIEQDVTDDMNFKGITIDNAYESKDYTFTGCLTDIAVGSWLVVGDACIMIIDPKQGADAELTFKVSDPSVFKTFTTLENGAKVHYIQGLKTGGAVLTIYADGDLIYRNAVNTRVGIKDPKLMLEQCAKVDFWFGVFSAVSGVGDYRLMFEKGDKGYYNSCSLSMLEVDKDYGTVKFDILVETAKEVNYNPLHALEFQLKVTEPVEEIQPVTILISLALDTIYVYDKAAITDFFKPVVVE